MFKVDRLRTAVVDFVLLEARDRLSGRILTVDESRSPSADGFDLGPSWFWPHAQPAMGELVATRALGVFAQNSEGDVIFERMSRETPPPVQRRQLACVHQVMSWARTPAAIPRGRTW